MNRVYQSGNVELREEDNGDVVLENTATNETVTLSTSFEEVVAAVNNHTENDVHTQNQPNQSHDNEDHDRDFVDETEAANAAPTQSVFGRVGDVVAEANDYAATQIQNFGSEVISTIDGSSISPSDISNLWDGQSVTADVDNQSVSTDEPVTVTKSGSLYYGNEPDDPDDNFDDNSLILGTDVDVPEDNEREHWDDGRYLLIGRRAGENASSGQLMAIGDRAGAGLADGLNVAIGHFAAADMQHPDNEDLRASGLVALGYESANGGGPLDDSSLIGYQAGYQADGSFLTAVGYGSGYGSEGDLNTFLGQLAGRFNDGKENVGVGSGALRGNTGSTDCVGVGYQALKDNTELEVTAIGWRAGESNTGTTNTFLGRASGFEQDGSNTIGIGYFGGRDNIGDENIFIGQEAGRDNAGSGVIGIGKDAAKANSENDVLLITDRNGNTRMKMDLTNGDLEIDGELTENADL